MRKWIPEPSTVIGLLVVAFLLFYLGSCGHTFATCKGHVLNNAFDWPVCVGGSHA